MINVFLFLYVSSWTTMISKVAWWEDISRIKRIQYKFMKWYRQNYDLWKANLCHIEVLLISHVPHSIWWSIVPRFLNNRLETIHKELINHLLCGLFASLLPDTAEGIGAIVCGRSDPLAWGNYHSPVYLSQDLDVSQSPRPTSLIGVTH